MEIEEEGLHGIPVQSGLMGLVPYLHIPDESPPIPGCCWLPTLTMCFKPTTSSEVAGSLIGDKREEGRMVGVTPCGDKLSNPSANEENPQNTSQLFVFQGGLPKLSLTSCKPWCVTKQSWKHQLCST